MLSKRNLQPSPLCVRCKDIHKNIYMWHDLHNEKTNNSTNFSNMHEIEVVIRFNMIRCSMMFKHCSTQTHYTRTIDALRSAVSHVSIMPERKQAFEFSTVEAQHPVNSGLHQHLRNPYQLKVSYAHFALQVLLVMKDWECFSHGPIWITRNVLLKSPHSETNTNISSKQWVASERIVFWKQV